MAALAGGAVPANRDVQAFVNASNANGLWYDVARANNAPRLALPPLAPFAWSGFPIVANPPTPICDDRDIFADPVGPGLRWPCDGLHNHHPAFVPDFPMWNRTVVHRRTCPKGGPYHAQGPDTYEVCDYCLFTARQQPWNVRIKQDVTHRPVNPLPQIYGQGTIPVPPRNPNTWTRFLTRLCRSCEIMELRVLHHRLTIVNAAQPQNINRMIGWRATWPHVTCTCLYAFAAHCGGQEDLCARHRRSKMVRFHNKRFVIKQQNDIWLRETGLDRGRLVWLGRTAGGQARIRDRARRGAFCGCRCGKDIKRTPNRDPEVLLCLGCEGIVHTNERRNWTQANADTEIETYAGEIGAVETRASVRTTEFDRRCNGDEPFNLRRPRV